MVAGEKIDWKNSLLRLIYIALEIFLCRLEYSILSRVEARVGSFEYQKEDRMSRALRRNALYLSISYSIDQEQDNEN